MNFKAVALTALTATTLGLATPQAAQARTFEFHGNTVYAIDNGSYAWDTLKSTGRNGKTTVNVRCTGNGGYEWKSFGNAGHDYNDALAFNWCKNW